ncbi:MAG: HAD-IA family hydrolase [Microbacterium arborescens]
MTTIPARAVLFDCDGVLVDSLEAAAIAWDEWAQRYAPEFDFRTQIEHGVRAADTVAALVAPHLLARAVAELDAAEIASATRTRPIAGAVALTDSLPAGSWAVVTSATRELARRRLAAAGHRAPGSLVSAEDVARGKPDPEPYLAGARSLRVPIAQCVVFEDAPAGVRSARAAGAGWVVGVGDHLDDADVDARIDDLGSAAWSDGALHLAVGVSSR